MVNCDFDARFTEEEFLVLMQGIIGFNSDKVAPTKSQKTQFLQGPRDNNFFFVGKKEMGEIDSETIKESFIRFIFERTSMIKDLSFTNNTFTDYFSLYERLGRDNGCLIGLESGLVNRFKSFLLGISVSNKKAYLVKFDVVC